MKLAILIFAITFILIIFILYLIGKRVKKQEELIKKMYNEREIKKQLQKIAKKRKNQSTPRVPRIK